MAMFFYSIIVVDRNVVVNGVVVHDVFLFMKLLLFMNMVCVIRIDVAPRGPSCGHSQCDWHRRIPVRPNNSTQW